MRPEVGNNFVCGILELGDTQQSVRSFLFIPDTNYYQEYNGYVRLLDKSHFILIKYNQGNTQFEVYEVTNDGSLNFVSSYISKTNVFCDRIPYELKDSYLLSGLNDIVKVDKATYSINHIHYPINNPYVEIIPIKYKKELNYYKEFITFVKKDNLKYDVVIYKDSFSLYKGDQIYIFEPKFDGNDITEDNLPYLTSYNEKNLYHYKASNGNYYILIENLDTVNRDVRFRKVNFSNLSRRYKYNVIEFNPDARTFKTLYTSTENTYYYIHQVDYTSIIYLYKIERQENKYIISVFNLEDRNLIGSTTVNVEKNFQPIAITHVRDELVILEGRDIVRDDFIGMEVLVTNCLFNSNFTINQSKLEVNLFCALKDGVNEKTIGLDLKGVTFYDTQITFAIYCGSYRYDANFVMVTIPTKDKFTIQSTRQPFTFSFINHPAAKFSTNYVKTGLYKSRYMLPYNQMSVIYDITHNLNEFRRSNVKLTNVYFSKYRQSLKTVDDYIFTGDLSIGYSYEKDSYIIPLQEKTDTLLKNSNFDKLIQSYVVDYSPEITRNIYILKYASRYPSIIATKEQNNRDIKFIRLPIIPVNAARTGYENIYILGLESSYIDTVIVDNYYDGCKDNTDFTKLHVYSTSSKYLQNEYVSKLDLKEFKAYDESIFSDYNEFFGLYNIDSDNIVVLKQTNVNAGIPISFDGTSNCKYYYEFDIYHGMSHNQLEYYGSIDIELDYPLKVVDFDENTKTIIYNQVIVFELNYKLYYYIVKNKIHLDKKYWYTFEEIYGIF